MYVVYIMCIHSFEIKEEGPVSGMLDRRDEDMLLDLLENDKFFCIALCGERQQKSIPFLILQTYISDKIEKLTVHFCTYYYNTILKIKLL